MPELDDSTRPHSAPIEDEPPAAQEPVPEATPTRADLFAPGQVLSEMFEIRKLLGSGGMGQVYEADDLFLHRRVALKASWPDVDPVFLRREAEALAAVRHPGVPAVYTLGNDGVDYMVMERVFGLSLRTHLSNRTLLREPFHADELIDILMGIADALAAIHGAGLAHRDVKPGNIILTPGNRVVLLDLGLALPEFEASAQKRVIGSPSYMAPEAILSSITAGSAYSLDLYALGIVAWELLTGHPPFESADVMGVFSRHVMAQLPELASVVANVPPALTRLVTELLSKDPADRPPAAEQVAWRLRQLRTPALSIAPSRPYHVLVVDDDADLQRVLQFYVKRAAPGAHVRVASDGQAALDAVSEEPPDLMLLDLNMPRMNGIEVCMYLRGTHRADGCTIVSVSAAAQEHDVEVLRSLGIRHFVVKGPALGEEVGKLVAMLRKARG